MVALTSQHCVVHEPHGPHWCPEGFAWEGTWVEDLCPGREPDQRTLIWPVMVRPFSVEYLEGGVIDTTENYIVKSRHVLYDTGRVVVVNHYIGGLEYGVMDYDNGRRLQTVRLSLDEAKLEADLWHEALRQSEAL